MKQKKVYGFKKAAIAHENGMTTSATPGLILPIPEIQVNLYFDYITLLQCIFFRVNMIERIELHIIYCWTGLCGYENN